MITFDGEWGLAMRLRGTPNFPRNMVLGCIPVSYTHLDGNKFAFLNVEVDTFEHMQRCSVVVGLVNVDVYKRQCIYHAT